jgi:hypothetical protein
MKVKADQEDIARYTDADLKDMFCNIPQITENLKIDASKLARFNNLSKNKNGEVTACEIDEEDMCPICLGEMYECNETVTYCKYSCGKSLHEECFNMYNSKKTGDIKCLFCHKNWKQQINNSAYVNIL